MWHPSHMERIGDTRAAMHQLAHRLYLHLHYPLLLHQQRGEGAQRASLGDQKQSCAEGLPCISSQHVLPHCAACAAPLHSSTAMPALTSQPPDSPCKSLQPQQKHGSHEDCHAIAHQPAHRPHLRP